MAITLEMPTTDLDNNTPPFDVDDPTTSSTTATANLAADLLERGEAERFEPDACLPDSLLPPAESPPLAESNGKSKRKRKPKADKGIELNADPAPAADQLKSPTPELSARMGGIKTSPASRKIQIAKVEAEYIEVSLTLNANEEIIESAKAEVKRLSEKQRALALELRHLRNDDQWQPELPLADSSTALPPPTPTPTLGSTGQATTHAGEPVPTTAVAAPVDLPSNVNPDAWRSVLVDDLGLPPSITAKLVEDSISTLGQLEDLRGEISQRRQKWPKGIGLAKITLIEDAVVKWLTANRDKAAFAEAGQSAAVPASDGIGPPANPSKTPPAAVFEGAWEDLSEQQQAEFIIARAAEINNGSPSCLDRKHHDSDRFWSAGYNDFSEFTDDDQSPYQLADCIYIPGIEMDDWIRGFLAAKAVEDYPTAKGNEPAPTPPPPPAPQSLGDDIDSI